MTTTTCHSCGAEIAPDADACWNCGATGDAMRGPPKSRGSRLPLYIVLLVVVFAASGAGIWYTTQGLNPPVTPATPAPAQSASASPERMTLPDWMRPIITRPNGAPAPAAGPIPAAPAPSAREVPAAAEALMIVDPIDGPFYLTFKQLLPADYTAIFAPLLAQVPDPQREHDRFDELLSGQLESFQARNARAIVAAETPVLAEMAANMQRSMRTTEICHAAMQGAYQPLPLDNIEARRIAAASNLSLIRAVASGRSASVARVPPSPTQVQDFNRDLQKRLTTQQWTSFQSGQLATLPVNDQCIVMAAYWSVIASYPPEEAAQWTAHQMSALIPAP